jgi:putative endonuclease
LQSIPGSSGHVAERLVLSYLREHEYTIIETNFVISNLGELDIIAEKDGVLCFVEVRSRATDLLGSPAETVGQLKQNKLKRLAETYLERSAPEKPGRFDVASVTFESDGTACIDYISDAFE